MIFSYTYSYDNIYTNIYVNIFTNILNGFKMSNTVNNANIINNTNIANNIDNSNDINNNSNNSQAPVIEIFSSIQGEGILVGRRQIFIRFAGCNLDCNYCDTSSSKNINAGNLMSIEDVLNKINELATPDLHSISFTGGEPLLHAEFISKVIANFDKLGYKSFLETNGTLPNQLKFLKNIDYVSLDIKLVEHFKNISKNNNGNFCDSNFYDYKETFNFWKNNIFKNELESIKILIEWNTNIYCKLVVYPKTKISEIEDIAIKVSDIILNNGNNINDENNEDNGNTIINVPFVIQPLSPIEQWHSDSFYDTGSNDISQNKLLEISSVIGKYMDVLTIPQLHKVLDIE